MNRKNIFHNLEFRQKERKFFYLHFIPPIKRMAAKKAAVSGELI
jgi:hypothetical protein